VIAVKQQPLVSIVTPFFNTATYLAECIESVLGQTYSNYEYLLVNNMSTDTSREIAEKYAQRDSRIKVFDNDTFVGQIENYNGALTRISPEGKYVKIVQADDALYAECVARMVALAECEPSIGLVSSYYLWGQDLCGSGVDPRVTLVAGREACRQMLLERRQLTGSQTTVLYRADIVRGRRPFYPLGRHFADTDAAFEVLLQHDLGYVHQILSFSRKENESILATTLSFHPFLLHLFLSMERFGPSVLSPAEFAVARAAMRREYYSFLARQWLRRPGHQFWDFHRFGLASIGGELRWRDIAGPVLVELARMALNPESTVEGGLRVLRRRRSASRLPSRITDG
jgi:glycosyltransferase involved in cell wall biosynthesis